MISLIAAMDRNRNIGLNGDMPWGKAMKADLNRFKEITSDNIIVMGRKTFESLPGILPFRAHVVLTKQDLVVKSPFVSTYNNIDDVLKMAKFEGGEIFIIGGAQIYQEFMPYADRIYLTKIHGYFEGDTKFPSMQPGKWELSESTAYPKDEDNPYPYSFRTYDRVREE